MDRKILNVLLIEDSPDYAELAQEWLSGTREEVAFVLSWTDSLAAGLDRLTKGAVDVVLLDLGLPDSDGVETFLATRRHAPGIPVIILSAAGSESLALQMIQQGAEDYLVKSTCTAELLVRALRYALIRRKLQVNQTAGATSERARLIGMVGVKGGVGTTTIACSLASALGHQTGKNVLLADLDLSSGLVSFLMSLDPKYSIADALNNVDRLDRDCWDAISVRASSALQIIASPPILSNDQLSTQGLRRLFTLISSFYDWIVIDFGRLNSVWQGLTDGIDELFVVTTAALPALHEAKRTIDAMVHRGLERDRLRLILNQAENTQALPGSELKQIFGIQVYTTLPNNSHELHQACLQRKLPSDSSAFGKEIVNLARKIAGLKEKQAKRNLPEFLSFVDRFRKTRAHVPLARTD